MSLQFKQSSPNAKIIEVAVEESVEELSCNIYQKFLRSHPEFRNLSTKTEEKILQKTLMSSLKDVLDNFEEYLESYCTEKLKQTEVY